MPTPLSRVRKHERIIHHHINTYDDWYRLIKATGKFVGSDNKSADYHLEMGYDNLYNITSKKLTMTQTNLQFAGTLSAGHEFSYNYSNDNPMQLASVETKQYNVDGTIADVDEALAKNIHTQDYEFDKNGNMISVSVAKKEEPKPEVENPEGQEASEEPEEKDILKSFLWDEENRLLAVNNNGSVSCYFYDAAGERTVKLTSETEMVHVNGKKVGGNANISKFIAYVSPYFVVSNGGAYTKHIYAADQRIASKLGNIDGFGADPRRVEQAGGKKYDDNQSGTIKARFEALNIDYSDGNGKKDDEEYEPTMDSEEKENLVFFYHPDHLGSTSYVTDADGNIAQHVEYIPYGEVFVEERNSQFSTNYLFNAKELDNETGLYYYGARYLDPTGAMWLSVDPMWEEYAGMSPYNYCAGNPVVVVDAEGRALNLIAGAIGAGVGALIGGGIEVASQLYNEGTVSNWNSVAGSAAQGAITGGVAGLTCGASLAATVVSTGTANVVGGEVNRRIQGKETKASDVALDAAVGCGSGALGYGLNKAISVFGTKIQASRLIKELQSQGVKCSPEKMLAIGKQSSGKIIFLEQGTEKKGMMHILNKHGSEFEQHGIKQSEIADFLMEATTKGKVVGTQGTNNPRTIFELNYKGDVKRVAVSIGNNGYIVGANMRSLE